MLTASGLRRVAALLAADAASLVYLHDGSLLQRHDSLDRLERLSLLLLRRPESRGHRLSPSLPTALALRNALFLHHHAQASEKRVGVFSQLPR